MRIKLPENFGGIHHNGEDVTLAPDADGCVDAEESLAQALLVHGGTIAPDPVEENERIDAEAESAQARVDALKAKKQKASR